ncbi:MAG: hypothetical protein Q9N34_06215 [Aquificota bacterium]|nr:hypothetical protein [Aquificota bacterium]
MEIDTVENSLFPGSTITGVIPFAHTGKVLKMVESPSREGHVRPEKQELITLRVLIPGGRVKSFRAEWDREQVPLGWRVLIPSKSGTATGIVVGVGREEAREEVLSFPDPSPILDTDSLSLIDELSSDCLLESKGYLLQKLLPSAFFWREEEVLKVSRTNLKGLDPKRLEVVEYVKRRRCKPNLRVPLADKSSPQKGNTQIREGLEHTLP